MKKLSKELLDENIKEAKVSLLQMGRDMCWNEISDDCLYILTEINEEGNVLNAPQKLNQRKYVNDRKTALSIDDALVELHELYSDLHDINLFIYHSKKKETIIEIQYFLKSNLASEYQKEVQQKDSMIHCKVGKPPYFVNKNIKFDINWELGGFRHHWKVFYHRKLFRLKMIFRRKQNRENYSV